MGNLHFVRPKSTRRKAGACVRLGAQQFEARSGSRFDGFEVRPEMKSGETLNVSSCRREQASFGD
jgi:hypothetical protein